MTKYEVLGCVFRPSRQLVTQAVVNFHTKLLCPSPTLKMEATRST